MNFEKFLTEKYQDLPGSKPVERAVEKEIQDGEKGPATKEERVEAYLDRLQDIISNPMGFRKKEGERGGFELLKHKILEKYTTKYEEIPESYWQTQEEEMRRRGEAADWAQASDEQKEEVKRKTAEAVLIDQRASLEQWVDYFGSIDSDYIPRELKYWVFRSVLGLQELVKKKEDDKEFIEFPKRSRGTVKSFPDINYEALSYVVNSMVEKLKDEGIEFEHDIQPEEREAFLKFLQKQDFAKLYAWANELMQPIPEHLLPITDGKWVRYDQDSDPRELVQTIRGKGTGWCTAGLNTARTHLHGGDFYVYYTLDDEGSSTIPRIAIRMEGRDKIAEDPRGIAYKQNLDPYMVPILDEKLKEFGPVGETYKKKSADMRSLTDIDNKVKAGENLAKDDLEFLYEFNTPIEGFGYQKDPRIAEILSQRNTEDDMPIIFECTKEQIANNTEEINENTKAYIGEWSPTIFQTIRQFPNIKHLYESFPEKKIFMYNLETDPEINSPEKAEKALIAKNIYLVDYGKDILQKTEFNREGKTYELVQFTVAQLGFPKGATTKEIYDKATKELGLELCPAEVGPHLRLQYKGADWKLIAMKQITDRIGCPDVFYLGAGGAGLRLDGSGARPGRRWGSDDGFVFLFRKSDA
ncbi:MAG: hypothetical protein AAB906_04800 [Patescibacteria group bacterium]